MRKQLLGFIIGGSLILCVGSFPTIILECIVYTVNFFIYGVWPSPINTFLEETFTFRFYTSLLGLDLILNKIWTMQFDTWGRLYLTGIMLLPLILSSLLMLYYEMKIDNGRQSSKSLTEKEVE